MTILRKTEKKTVISIFRFQQFYGECVGKTMFSAGIFHVSAQNLQWTVLKVTQKMCSKYLLKRQRTEFFFIMCWLWRMFCMKYDVNAVLSVY